MDYTDNELLTWLIQYGSIALFLLLTLGIIALPVPDETLLILSGILIKSGHLNASPTMLAAYAGAICGISISYVLGRTCGYYIINRYGGWIGLTEERLQQTHQWFDRFGKWMLLIGYFIPGVRHFTGLSTGMMELEYKQFAFFAYLGACVWVTAFLSMGYFFGDYCCYVFENTEITLEEISLALIILLAIVVIVKIAKRKR